MIDGSDDAWRKDEVLIDYSLAGKGCSMYVYHVGQRHLVVFDRTRARQRMDHIWGSSEWACDYLSANNPTIR